MATIRYASSSCKADLIANLNVKIETTANNANSKGKLIFLQLEPEFMAINEATSKYEIKSKKTILQEKNIFIFWRLSVKHGDVWEQRRRMVVQIPNINVIFEKNKIFFFY